MKSIGYLLLLCIIRLFQISERLGKFIISLLVYSASFLKKILAFISSSLTRFKSYLLVLKKSIFKIARRKIRVFKKQLAYQKEYIEKKWRLFLKRTKKKLKRKVKHIQLPELPEVELKKKVVILGIGVLLIGTSGYVVHGFLSTIPDPKMLSDFQMPAATVIYDRNNILLYSAYDDSYRVPVSLKQVPQTLIDATIAAEDKRFYTHPGVDPIAIIRAIFQNTKKEYASGASTISQQLAKNIFLTNEKTFIRKLKELVIALRIERRFSKDQILELYFNTVPYGGVASGVEAASQKYFGKHAYELSRKECVFLASLPAAPSIYSHVDSKKTQTERMEYILDRMVEDGKLTVQAKKQIEKEDLAFVPQIIYKRAPHAVDFVLKTLEEKYGKDFVLHKGLIVKTTIDLSLQNYIQQVALENIASSYDRNLTNAGVMVSDPKTGEILAMVGSVNYYDPNQGQYNVVTAKRQLGSTLKLLTYAQAFEKGYTPESTIKDEPTLFAGYPDYKPRNYDGKFHGVVTLRSALANSYNIPALKLAYSLGIDNIARLGVRMGISEFGKFSD